MNEGTKVDLSGAAAAVKEMKKENTANLADAYVEKPVLNPDTIGASLLDRMPHPTGWRILILPYQGRAKTSGRYIYTRRS